MHNGQTISTCSGKRPIYISQVTPKLVGFDPDESVAKNVTAKVGYRFRLAQLQLGSILQLTAAVTRGGNYVVLDVHNRINELNPLAPLKSAAEPVENRTPSAAVDPAELAALIERPDYSTYELSTTVRCPRDEVVLVGGVESIESGAEPAPQMYLFVKTSIYNVVLDENFEPASMPSSPESTSGKPQDSGHK